MKITISFVVIFFIWAFLTGVFLEAGGVKMFSLNWFSWTILLDVVGYFILKYVFNAFEKNKNNDKNS